MEGCKYYNAVRQIRLVFSPDDNGWYWQQTFGDWLTSKVFPTRQTAMAADEEDMEWG
jgi:hypothetical protein